MSTLILHGTWLADPGRFFIWAEAGALAAPRRGSGKIPLHPFHAPVDRVRARLPGGTRASEEIQTVWLPSVGGKPVPSPEILATGARTAPQGQAQLKPWRVTGLSLWPNDALDCLVGVPAGPGLGADWRAWRTAALLALELVAKHQVMPALRRDNGHLRAFWQADPTPDIATLIGKLARSLPPLCRAVTPRPGQALLARDLLDRFLTASVDAAIRAMPLKPTRAPTTAGGQWLAALLGPNDVLNLSRFEADRLMAEWQAWSDMGRAAGDDAFRVTFRLEAPEAPDALWNLTYWLQAADDPSLMVPAAQLWRERGATFRFLERRLEQPQERLLAGLGRAATVFPPVQASLREAAPERAQLSANEAYAFLREVAPLLEGAGFGVLVPAWWAGGGSARLQARAQASSPKVEGPSRLGLQQIIKFNWELTLNGETLTRAELEQLAALKQPLVQVRGQWVVLDPNQVKSALKLFEKPQGSLPLEEVLRLGLGGPGAGQTAPGDMEISSLQADGWLGELLTQLQQPVTRLEVPPMPQGLTGELRPYQVRGFAWLAFLRRYGLGACLADDMGLGKTIQTIALLLHERERLGVTAPALLVCPTSVVGNWQHELERFAPGLRVLAHRGVQRGRGEAFAVAAREHDIVLTSYALLARDREELTQVEWSTAVLDEAQNIKNPSTKQAQAARALKAANRIALTGTPVENRLSELWSIMAYLNPGFLGSQEAFRRAFARPIERMSDAGAAARLRRLTGPFVLRRVKTDPNVIADLPDKLDMKVFCPLTREQASLYEAIVQDVMAQVEQAEAGGASMQRRGLVLAMLMKLKQVCNHPAQFLKDGSPLPGRSGKLQRLVEMLDEVCAAGDRALVFTQFAEMGMLLQSHLAAELEEEVLFLHGGTPARQRDEMVRRFQAPQGPRIFLLSLKAGGTGLNLTAANHVFHFDRWWNPAVEDQATDRAFRIGQRRDVQVHKFVCQGTLEDRIDELIESKRSLADAVLGPGENWLTELDTSELRDLVALRREYVVEE